MEEYYKHYMDHIPTEITEDIERYVDDVVLKDSRYLFITRKGRKHYSYCTHCNKISEVNFKIKHNSTEHCPECGSKCIMKYSGYSRKFLIDKACYLRFDKSLIDPNIIVARGYFVYRDYRVEYEQVETKYNLVASYIFNPGVKSVMLDRYSWCGKYKNKNEGWNKRNSVFLFTNNCWEIAQCFIDRKSLNLATNKNLFGYMNFDKYYYEDLLKVVSLYSNYPIVEHLDKLGMNDLICAKLNNAHTYSAINWKGKDIYKALKINKWDLNILRESEVKITPLLLRLYQIQKKDGSKLGPKELSIIAHSIEDPVEFIKLLKHGSLKKIYSYIRKQRDTKMLQSYYNIISTYRDYLQDCAKLNMDLKDKHVLFPKNLLAAHQNTIKQIKYKEDKALNSKIEKRLKQLEEKYCFEYNGIFIRPATSSLQLINEGQKLEHCVGGYAGKYAEGQTDILLIRKTNNPSEPYFTIEVRNNRVVQVHGLRNCNPADETAQFVEIFKAEKLEKNEKIRLTA